MMMYSFTLLPLLLHLSSPLPRPAQLLFMVVCFTLLLQRFVYLFALTSRSFRGKYGKLQALIEQMDAV